MGGPNKNEDVLQMSVITLQKLTIPTLSIKELDNPTDEVNKKIINAAQLGCFYVDLTEDWRPAIDSGRSFAEKFPSGKNAFQKIFREDLPIPIGFSVLPGHQCESFRLVTKDLWNDHLPQEVVKLGDDLVDLSRKVIQATLRAFNVPEHLWESATGGSIKEKHSSTFTFNRYVSAKEGNGLPAHKDSGLVTVAFINESGIEGRICNEKDWSAISPRGQSLLIKFGQNFEMMFAKDPNRPLLSMENRVAHLDKDQVSFCLYFDQDQESHIHQIIDDRCEPVPSEKEMKEKMTNLEFQQIIVRKLFHGK